MANEIENVIKALTGTINGFIKPQEVKRNMIPDYRIASTEHVSNGQPVVFSTEPSAVRLTPVLPPYKYNNTVNGIQFNSQ